jgi:hypothetical protein
MFHIPNPLWFNGRGRGLFLVRAIKLLFWSFKSYCSEVLYEMRDALKEVSLSNVRRLVREPKRAEKLLLDVVWRASELNFGIDNKNLLE